MFHLPLKLLNGGWHVNLTWCHTYKIAFCLYYYCTTIIYSLSLCFLLLWGAVSRTALCVPGLIVHMFRNYQKDTRPQEEENTSTMLLLKLIQNYILLFMYFSYQFSLPPQTTISLFNFLSYFQNTTYALN